MTEIIVRNIIHTSGLRHAIEPEPSVHKPLSTRSKLDLPQPEGPTMRSDWPSASCRFRSSATQQPWTRPGAPPFAFGVYTVRSLSCSTSSQTVSWPVAAFTTVIKSLSVGCDLCMLALFPLPLETSSLAFFLFCGWVRHPGCVRGLPRRGSSSVGPSLFLRVPAA